MEGLVFLALVVIPLVVFDLLATRFGVDSSDSSTDPRRPYRPTGIVVS
ncbi:MAG TPA: hypothetical protein VKA85_12020 [Candidatus Limnocylindrales bacterium]|nr:hypothetical protein [Candidatus Limnocylindrales bacterium]